MPVEYVINESKIVKDPKGLKASRLTIKSVISTAPKKNVYTIFSILDNMGITVSDICFNSYADYNEFSNKDLDEKDGAVINIGEEKTEVSIFKKGILVETENIELGSKNIDRDICYIYDISRSRAREIKEKSS